MWFDRSFVQPHIQDRSCRWVPSRHGRSEHRSARIMVMNRLISQVTPAHTLVADGDMLLKRAIPIAGPLDAVGPFVFFDHYRSNSARGIGDRPHPHAGVELISYLLDGEMEHRDSMGFRDRLRAGDAQWIRAGRGMIHAEQPLGGRHGVQVWAMLPKITRFAEPLY